MKRILMVIIGTLICALSFNIFMVPHDILPGGVSGVSLIINHFMYINNALFIFVVSIILLIVSLLLLGWRDTKHSIIGSLLFPLFVYLTEIGLKYYPINIESTFLAVICGGVAFGFGLGLVYKEGYTTGGTNIINQIISKFFHTSMGMGLLLTEGTITIIGGIVLGFNVMMYSIICLYLSSFLIDKVMLGISSKKSFYIISEKPKDVSEFIMNNLNHGVTIINGKGAYTNEKKEILLTVIPTNDYYKLKEGIKEIDSDAFFVVSDSYEVSGGE